MQCRTFDDMTEVNIFDGVWACASLLNVHKSDLASVIGKLTDSLHVGGVLYASFMAGTGERIDEGGRHFTDITRASVTAALRS